MKVKAKIMWYSKSNQNGVVIDEAGIEHYFHVSSISYIKDLDRFDPKKNLEVIISETRRRITHTDIKYRCDKLDRLFSSVDEIQSFLKLKTNKTILAHLRNEKPHVSSKKYMFTKESTRYYTEDVISMEIVGSRPNNLIKVKAEHEFRSNILLEKITTSYVDNHDMEPSPVSGWEKHLISYCFRSNNVMLPKLSLQYRTQETPDNDLDIENIKLHPVSKDEIIKDLKEELVRRCHTNGYYYTFKKVQTAFLSKYEKYFSFQVKFKDDLECKRVRIQALTRVQALLEVYSRYEDIKSVRQLAS